MTARPAGDPGGGRAHPAETLDRARSSDPLAELAAGLSHELANPLAGVVGLAELLLRRTTSPDARADLEGILREAQRCEAVLRRLADAVRQPGGERLPVSVAEVFGAVAVATGERRRREHVEWSEDVAPGVPEVAGSRRRIEQAVQALAANALDAIAAYRGSGRVTLAARRDGDSVWVAVTDDGGGMSARTTARMFEPFFSTREAGGGRGLGCCVVRAVAAEHGGEVSVESRLGVGTTMRMRFPAWSAGGLRRPSSHPPAAGSSRQTLVAVARPDDAEWVVEGLDQLRWRYRVVCTPEEAQAFAGRTRFDAAVVDTALVFRGRPLADVLEAEHGLKGRVIRVRLPGGPTAAGAIDGPADPGALAVALGLALVGQAGAGLW